MLSCATSQMLPSTLQQFVTKQDYAYERLLQAIVQGKLRPGTRLPLEKLSKTFGTSRTPLREAVRRLQTEGLVVIEPHRGAVVADFSTRELVELYRIRAVLDGLAVRLATPAVTASDLQQMAALLTKMNPQTRSINSEQLSSLNWQFHEILYRRASSPTLYEMITKLYNKTQCYRIASFKNLERATTIIGEHNRLYEAVLAGDPGAA